VLSRRSILHSLTVVADNCWLLPGPLLANRCIGFYQGSLRLRYVEGSLPAQFLRTLASHARRVQLATCCARVAVESGRWVSRKSAASAVPLYSRICYDPDSVFFDVTME